MQQVVAAYYAKGLLTFTSSEEPLKTVKQLSEALKTFEKLFGTSMCVIAQA